MGGRGAGHRGLIAGLRSLEAAVNNEDQSIEFCKGCEQECSEVGIENASEFVVGLGRKTPLVDGREVPS